jgi:Putative NADPH-quinone reductase (modulator of drug activity B)
MAKNILVLLGHTDTDSFTASLADHYQAAAEEAGHNVARVNIGDMQFDPVLHKGYKEIQALEPDLLALQDRIREADHIVIAYPNWWCTMPAKLKGLFDRMWLPGFAFNFNKDTKKIEQHLVGKTARVLIVAGTHSPFMTWWQFGDYTNEIQYGILGFAGIRANVSAFGPCEKVNDSTREKWVQKVDTLGRKGI